MKWDLARIGLPLQIAGFAALIVACFAGSLLAARIGTPVHLAGDILFFLAMKRRGCL